MANQIFNMFNSMVSNQNSNPFGNASMLNPQNMILNMMKQQNPQMFQAMNQIMQSGANPQQLVQQQLRNMNPQQIEQAKQMARQMGMNEQQIGMIDNIANNIK